MAVKLGIKGLKSSLDAMKCKCSPPTDACSEYEIHENIKSSQIIYGMHCGFNYKPLHMQSSPPTVLTRPHTEIHTRAENMHF